MRATWMVLVAPAMLAACQPSDGDNNSAEAAAKEVVNLAEFGAQDNSVLPIPDPAPYVPEAGELAGDNVMTTAVVGLSYYRDLPAARVLKGQWVIEDADWFPVAGNETPARSAQALAAIKGARVTVERGRIALALPAGKRIEAMMTECERAAYIDKDRLVAAEMRNNVSNATREDVMQVWSAAVAERDLSRRFYKSGTLYAQLLAVHCEEADPHDQPTEYLLLSGVLPIERNKMILVWQNGIAALAHRVQ